ncbi:MAG: hypothetical protein ABFD89_01560 [Bryobacteraceae bacterium]
MTHNFQFSMGMGAARDPGTNRMKTEITEGTKMDKTAIHISQIDLVAKIANLLATDFGLKQATEKQFNAIIEAADIIVEAMRHEFVPAAEGIGLFAWLASDDTGLSSRCMARTLWPSAGIPEERHFGNKSHPLDPDDFGRCHRFLEAVPEAKARIGEMSAVSKQWAGLVAAWDELTALYLEELPSGRCPKLYARMEQILKDA